MHQTDLVDTLITCRLAGHQVEAIVVGLQPFDYHTMQPELTPQAAALLPQFCQKVVRLLQERGLATAAPLAEQAGLC